jgi:hypothetical protein
MSCIWGPSVWGLPEWVSDYCFTPNETFFSYIMARTSYIRWDDDNICFVLDQHALLDIDSARSLKQWVDMSLHSDVLFWFLALIS